MVKAYAITTVPFKLAEALTGIFSLATGRLSIPPMIGAGTLLDVAILIIGLIILLMRALRIERAEVEGPVTSIDDR